jgi:uncharacterized protein YdcH (DUF465 family)
MSARPSKSSRSRPRSSRGSLWNLRGRHRCRARDASKADSGGRYPRLEKAPLSRYDCGKEPPMTKTPAEPTNLVLEQLRVMRAETNARFDQVEARFNAVDAKIAGIEKELRGLKLNTIAEIYKANLTVASFADHERRIQELERKSS